MNARPATLNGKTLAVGTKVTIMSSRYSRTSFVETTVAKVTETMVTLANGRAFNLVRASRYGFSSDLGNVKRGERKTAKSQWPDDFALLIASDDPWLIERRAQEERFQQSAALETEAIRAVQALANGRYLNTEKAQAAIGALQAMLANRSETKAAV